MNGAIIIYIKSINKVVPKMGPLINGIDNEVSSNGREFHSLGSL